jgi:hypothetical protein
LTSSSVFSKIKLASLTDYSAVSYKINASSFYLFAIFSSASTITYYSLAAALSIVIRSINASVSLEAISNNGPF